MTPTLELEGALEPMAGGSKAPAVDRAWPQELFKLPVNLDGGEIIILAIKPSTWFILFDSIVWLTACLAAIVGSGWISNVLGWTSQSMVMQAAMTAAGVRLGIAVLCWASRFYVLTNRRIMRVQGMWRVDVFAASLLNIRTSRVTTDMHERLTRTGSIRFNIEPPVHADPSWTFISQPEEVHEQIRRAIQRAIDNHG